jgi:hypothetical protein
MKSKMLRIVLLLMVVSSVLFISCSRRNSCMRFHNDDVKRGLAH